MNPGTLVVKPSGEAIMNTAFCGGVTFPNASLISRTVWFVVIEKSALEESRLIRYVEVLWQHSQVDPCILSR
jgi:hypothetical protein